MSDIDTPNFKFELLDSRRAHDPELGRALNRNWTSLDTILNNQGASPVFSLDVNGLVKGPTTDDISNGRIIDANNNWIDPPGGGLNQFKGVGSDGIFTESASGGNAGGRTENNLCSIIANSNGALVTGDTQQASAFTAVIDGSSQGGSTAAYVSAVTVNSSFNVWGTWGCHGRGYAIDGNVSIDGSGSIGDVNVSNGGDAQTQGDNARIYGQANGAASIILASNDNTVVDAWPSAGEIAQASGNRCHQIGVGVNAVAKSYQIGAGVLHVVYDPAAPKIGMFTALPVVQQVHVADPTDLATCITAITAINAKDAAFGLTAAA